MNAIANIVTPNPADSRGNTLTKTYTQREKQRTLSSAEINEGVTFSSYSKV